MYRLGQGAQIQAAMVANQATILRDGIAVTVKDDDELLRKLITFIQRLSHRRKLTIRLISGTPFWDQVREVLLTDRLFANAVSEMANTFDIHYAVDDYCTKMLLEMFPEFTHEMQQLAGALAKSLMRGHFHGHAQEMFKRHLTWTAATGFTPCGFIPMEDIGKSPQSMTFLSRGEVESLAEGEDAMFSRGLFGDLFEPRDFRRLTLKIPGAPPSVARTVGILYNKLVPRMDADDARLLGLTLIGIMRRHYSSYLPYIPPVNLTETRMVYAVDTDECYAIDKAGHIFRSFGDPMGGPVLSSPVFTMRDYSKKFQGLLTDYMKAASMNAKRTVVTAPQYPKRGERLEGLFSRELAQGGVTRATYENLLQYTGALNQHRRAMVADGAAAGLVAAHQSGLTDPNSTALNHLLRTNAGILQDNLFQDFNERLATLKDDSERYGTVREFLSAIETKNFTMADNLLNRCHGADRDSLERLLALVGKGDGHRGEIPEIHRLPEHTKLLCSFTTNISLPEIEELLHLWTVMWESTLTETNLFTRRKHALQYTTEGAHSKEPGVPLQLKFLELLNAPGPFVGKLYPNKQSTLTFTELMVLTEKIDPLCIPEIFANQIGLCPSDVRLKQMDLPPQAAPSSAPHTATGPVQTMIQECTTINASEK
uniref:Core protein n=1 Tax=Latid herpesvirus 1 TaxID=3096545 RepID=A0AB33V6N1_9VIRU